MPSMQYSVPQFIEVESKVIGPISIRQFIILLVTVGVIFIFYELFSFTVFIIPGILTLTIGVVFAFAKINSQFFHVFILSVIQTLKRPKLSVWQHDTSKYVVEKTGRNDNAKERTVAFKPKLSASPSQISELSLIMDSGGKYIPQNNNLNRINSNDSQTTTKKN